MIHDDLTPEQLFELVTSALVPFLCEHTGFARRHIENVLRAEQLFWASRPHQLHRLMGLMQPFDPEDE